MMMITMFFFLFFLFPLASVFECISVGCRSPFFLPFFFPPLDLLVVDGSARQMKYTQVKGQ